MILASNHKLSLFFIILFAIIAFLIYMRLSKVKIMYEESVLVEPSHFSEEVSIDYIQNETLGPRNDNVMRMLWWTSFYGGFQKLNRTITCGSVVCELTSNKSLLDSSHVVIFHGWRTDMKANVTTVEGKTKYIPVSIPPKRHLDQYWLLFMLESPYNYREHMRSYDALFNWTMTYRTGSDIYMPYGKFQKVDKLQILGPQSLAVPLTKTKLIGWILSNCRNVSSKRLDLVKKLQEEVPVDIYGKCGPLKCKTKSCKKEISPYYKFYLALENSPCQDYVTEKVFHTYQEGMVPIVYGSANYDLFLPRGSFININNFPSAKALANYLLYLDRNDDEYLKYFKWKKHTKLVKNSFDFSAGYCEICKKLHRDYPARVIKIIPNMTEWLFGNNYSYNVCNEPLIWE